MADRTMIEALNLALHEMMDSDDSVVVLGEDVGQDEGIFRLTRGLLDRFGDRRVIDTPLAEAGIVGTSIGMAIGGLKPVCEIQFSGFNYQAMHQLESHAARMRWRSRGGLALPMVVRMPYGAGVRALEHHSESKEVWFAHTPGLKMVIPSTPENARELLVAAIRDPDPVVFFEPKALYRSGRQEVPDRLESDPHPIGKGRCVRKGKDLTIITFGAMVTRSLEAANLLAEDHIEAEVIDLLTISPMDDDIFIESVKKTGRALIVHEAHRSFGVGAEIIARINERCLFFLEAPVERVTGFDVHVPYFGREQAYLPDAQRIVRAGRRAVTPIPAEKVYVQSV